MVWSNRLNMRWNGFNYNDNKYTIEMLRYGNGYEGYLYKNGKIVKDPRPPNFAMRYRASEKQLVKEFYLMFVQNGHATIVAD